MSARRYPSLSEQIACLRQMGKDEVLATWQIEGCLLDAADALCLADEVQRLTGVGQLTLHALLAAARDATRTESSQSDFDSRLGDRAAFFCRVEDRTEQAKAVEAAIEAKAALGTYISFGAILCEVATKHLPHTHRIDDQDAEPPPVSQIVPLDDVAILGRVEAVAMFYTEKKDGPSPIGVPPMIVDILLKQRCTTRRWSLAF